MRRRIKGPRFGHPRLFHGHMRTKSTKARPCPVHGRPMRKNGRTAAGSQRWKCVDRSGVTAPRPDERRDAEPRSFLDWLPSGRRQDDMVYFVKLRWTCSALNLNTVGVQLEHRRRLVPCFVVCLVYFMRECLFR